jgi:hypothetical protein
VPARLTIALLAVCAVVVGVLGPTAAVAQDDGGTDPTGETSTTLAPSDLDFIPQPNSGTPPEDLGDRGGAGQLALFALVCAGIALIFGLAYRESRRARAARR